MQSEVTLKVQGSAGPGAPASPPRRLQLQHLCIKHDVIVLIQLKGLARRY